MKTITYYWSFLITKQLRFELGLWDNLTALNYDILILRPKKHGPNRKYFTLEEMEKITEALCNEFREIISSPNYVEHKIFVYNPTVNTEKNTNSYQYDITNEILQEKYLYDKDYNYKF